MKKESFRWLFPLFPAAVLVLGAIPKAVVMRFMRDPALGGEFLHYCSYYDLLPFGYGNMGPLLTMGLSAILTVISGWNAIRPNLLRQRYTVLIAGAAFVASLLNILFREMTVYGYSISALLLVMTLAQILYNRK